MAKKKVTLNIDGNVLMEIKIRAIREETNLSALTEKLYEKHLKESQDKR
jgi:hypothetical protein